MFKTDQAINQNRATGAASRPILIDGLIR